MEYTLIQQTPIIHFQHDQKGATLRATEVKPKLDKFIVNKLGGKDNVPKNWFISDTKALNYKLRICDDGGKKTEKLGFGTSYAIYYGNMGNADIKKEGVVCNCKMTITCFYPDLMKKISEILSEFFIVTNFGTMQNKGFGSYIVKGSDVSPSVIAGYLKENYNNKKCYTFKPGANVFEDIKNVYAFMKSGRNYKGYQRSLLFLFLHEKYGLGNEKAWLKQQGLAPCDVGRNAKEWNKLQSTHPHCYARALLGVGDHVEFIEDINNKRNKTTVGIKSSVVERVASPIFFKVINNNVYYVAKTISDKVYGAEFEFASKNSRNKPIGKDNLSVPKKEQLSDSYMQEFLDYCMKKLNNEVFCNFADCNHLRIEEVD